MKDLTNNELAELVDKIEAYHANKFNFEEARILQEAAKRLRGDSGLILKSLVSK